MKARIAILSGAAAVWLAACIPSVNPYYTDSDVVFDPGLIGEWTDSGSESWTFERLGEEDAYRLTIVESDGGRGTLRATLFQLKDYRFLDLIATDVDFADSQAEITQASVFPGHVAMHVAETEPNLNVAFFDFEWLADHLEENPRALSHVDENDRPLLTGKTRELRRFLLKHIDDGDLFSDYGELTRAN